LKIPVRSCFRLDNTQKMQFHKKIFLLEALNNDELGDYSAAKESLTQYFEANFSQFRADSLNMCLRITTAEEVYHELKARRWRKYLNILPGLGLYMQVSVIGAFNFLLNAACLTAGVYEIYYGFYFTGYFAGAAVLSKFYFGGRSLTRENDRGTELY